MILKGDILFFDLIFLFGEELFGEFWGWEMWECFCKLERYIGVYINNEIKYVLL